jgi:molybdate transport system substrate-binding protein
MHYLKMALASLAVIAVMCSGSAAGSAEIKVLASGSLKGALSRLAPDFQKASGNTVTIEYGPAGAVVARIQKDDAADVVIVSRSQIEKLASSGKVLSESLVNVAGIALGVAVRKGAPKPDISSAEAFKHALLAARSIGYRDPVTGSTSGIYAASLIERLGLAEDLKPKLRLDRTEGDAPENVFRTVASGEIEMQIGQITEIVIAPGVELAGPDAASVFIRFISSPSAAAVLTATGFVAVKEN